MPTDPAAVAGRRPEREAAPATADVEHAVARLQGELCADHLELACLLLGGLEGLGAAREDRAAVGHRVIEKEREVLVGDVVVVPYGARVSLAAVAASAGAQLAALGRRGRRPVSAARTAPKSSARLSARSRLGGFEALEQLDHGVHVVDLDISADVGAAEPELSGGAQQVGGGAWRAHEECGPAPALAGERECRPRTRPRRGALGCGWRSRAAAPRCWQVAFCAWAAVVAGLRMGCQTHVVSQSLRRWLAGSRCRGHRLAEHDALRLRG